VAVPCLGQRDRYQVIISLEGHHSAMMTVLRAVRGGSIVPVMGHYRTIPMGGKGEQGMGPNGRQMSSNPVLVEGGSFLDHWAPQLVSPFLQFRAVGLFHSPVLGLCFFVSFFFLLLFLVLRLCAGFFFAQMHAWFASSQARQFLNRGVLAIGRVV
jgi:hypothetical protein